MKQIWNFLFSSKFSMLLLAVFILTIGAATFIEDHYDTPTAKLLIYEATWFELVMVLLVVLFVGNQFRKYLFVKEKIPQLLFHCSFIVLIIGGGITRYNGFEANMHIAEDESVNVLYSVKPYLQVRSLDRTIDFTSDTPLYFSQIGTNEFHLTFDDKENNPITIDFQEYIFNAKELYTEQIKSGIIENHSLDLNDPDQKFPDALIVAVTNKAQNYKAVLFYDDMRYIQPFTHFTMGDLQLEMTYGPKPIGLPFSLQLKQFTLTKYPGTNIPSASESEVVLIDERHNIKEEHLIAKNKVLDYDGYRFFQTSYDDDEKGTILTVNYDYVGTRITYLGYIMMTLGALLILFSKISVFSQLDTKIKQVRAQRKKLLMSILFIVGFSCFGHSQNNIQNPISYEHAEQFGHLLVQTYDGRFSSVHSLATDVIHKITGKDKFNIPGKGTLDAMQLFLDMHVDPDFWKYQKMIVVREQALRDILGISGKYAPFSVFFDDQNRYKLEELAQKAFQKKAADQSTLEREIIKVTERVNIFSMTINGTLLKVFPEQDSENNKWISWNEELAFKPISESILMLNSDLKLAEFNYSNIMRSYLVSTITARESNDYSTTNKIMGYIHSIQRQLTPNELLPSARKIEMEVLYNKSKIFHYLKYVYLLLGITLLILTFIENFRYSASKWMALSIKILVTLIIVAFIYQTYGMGLRWYLGGHAPWSNGYEVLLLVAWGGMLAGFSVMNYSKVTLAATSLLAFMVLMTAGHSYYDPQLTNLNPVLKSYWLIIHVAIITIGYGFLALSFLLGLMNINLYLFMTKKKKELFNLTIQELTYINEKLITIGMLLTAIGTFIGCVWANESWGNYWSWNAKQVWSLIIVLIYGVILHFKYIPGMKSSLTFNIGSIISFGSVLMTFIGVNYYFTKGLHSYASDDPPIFPLWAWIAIIALLSLILFAIIKKRTYEKKSF